MQLKDIGFAEINTDTINAFLEWLGTYHGCGLNTQNHHLSVIRAFLKYAGAKDPMLNSYYLASFQVPRRKADKQLTVKHFSEEVLNAILKQPNPKVRNQHRDLFFMILLYDTGARDSEILGLTPKDVVANTSAPYIIVHGKGKKIRMVPIMEETTFHYKSYLKRFHKDLDEASLCFIQSFMVSSNKCPMIMLHDSFTSMQIWAEIFVPLSLRELHLICSGIVAP